MFGYIIPDGLIVRLFPLDLVIHDSGSVEYAPKAYYRTDSFELASDMV